MDVVRLGLGYRALRRKRAWTQQQVAHGAGVSRACIQRIERGGADSVNGGALRRVAAALGARFEQRLLWQGEALDRLLDEDHARLVDGVVRWLRSHGWEAVPEVTFAIYGERGSIDILAFHPATGSLLVVEVKTVVPDMQGMLSTLDRKVRLAPRIARDRGWTVRTTSRLLVLPEDSTVRRRVTALQATVDAILPSRTVAARRWAANPTGPFAGVAFLRTATHGRHRVSPGRAGGSPPMSP
jgi:transcriptional regulator with XRE-family HTH domain